MSLDLFFFGGPWNCEWRNLAAPYPVVNAPVKATTASLKPTYLEPFKHEYTYMSYQLRSYTQDEITVRLYVPSPGPSVLPMDVFMHLISRGQYRGFDPDVW